jgi:hypothetical protein
MFPVVISMMMVALPVRDAVVEPVPKSFLVSQRTLYASYDRYKPPTNLEEYRQRKLDLINDWNRMSQENALIYQMQKQREAEKKKNDFILAVPASLFFGIGLLVRIFGANAN